MPTPITDPLLRHARREALVAFGVWLLAMCYTVGYCYLFGYGRNPRNVQLIYGVPAWVLWGVVAPWTACTVVSWWYTFGLVSDDELGPDLDSTGDALLGDDLPAVQPPSEGQESTFRHV
jgi:hypothetical protein